MKMQYTEEQIARANQTDLVSFLNAQGEQLVNHICEFAEKMELSGSKVEPINQSEPSKNKTRNREKQR